MAYIIYVCMLFRAAAAGNLKVHSKPYTIRNNKKEKMKKTFTVLKVPITHEILCILAGKAHSHLRLDWSHGTMLYNLGDRIQFPNLRCCLQEKRE